MTQSAPQPSMQQIPGTWDLIAPTYAEDVFQWLAYAREAIHVLPVSSSDRVLDVACGPGTMAFLAAERATRVDAVDFSPGMIEQVRARAAREGVANVEGAVMDAQALGFADATFDAAFCFFAFFFFPDRAKAFSELYRVLRPGGRLLIGTWGPIERRPVMKIGFDAMAEAFPQFPRPSKGDLQSIEDCEREMSAAGFRDVEVRPFSASVHFENAEKYVEMMVRSGAPFAVMKQKMEEGQWAETMSRFTDAVRSRLPAGGAELSAEAILTMGTK